MQRILATATTLLAATGLAVSAHAFSAPPAQPQAQSPVVKVSDGHYSCGWFAITVCSKSYSGAQKGANRYGGYVIDTDDIDGFRGGWQCAVMGPSSKSKARSRRNQAKRNGASSAYIKRGCGVNL